jgi:hypothetical protein
VRAWCWLVSGWRVGATVCLAGVGATIPTSQCKTEHLPRPALPFCPVAGTDPIPLESPAVRERIACADADALLQWSEHILTAEDLDSVLHCVAWMPGGWRSGRTDERNFVSPTRSEIRLTGSA